MNDDPSPSRNRIRDAALTLFARFGVEQTKLADIARRAGLSKATLYHHFPDGKGSIFDSAVDALVRAQWDDTVRRVSAEQDPISAFFAYVQLRIDHFDRGLATWGVDRKVWFDIKPWVEHTLRHYLLEERALLERLLRALADAGYLREGDPVAVSGFVQSVLRGMTLEGPVETTALARSAELRELRSFLARAVLSDAGITNAQAYFERAHPR